MDNQISKEELTKKLISILSGALRISPEKISTESKLVKDLNAESLDLLDIRFSIEQEFGFSISEHEFAEKIGKGLSSAEFLEKFTVSSLIDFTEGKLKTKVPV